MYIQSLIGLVPKDKGLETCLIFHLSYDFSDGSKSVNFHTPAHLCSVHYSDLDTAVRLCLWLQRHGSGTVFFSKMDGKSAFRVLPLKRSCLRWVVMKASDPKTGKTMYFVDKCLPFRSSISCSHFQRVSNALKHLAEYRANKRNFLSNYLDDFLFLACLMQECNRLMMIFLDMCAEVGFPISKEKTVWATLQIVFLGILLNGQSFTLSIPLEKHLCAQQLIEKFLHSKKATIRELQQLCGYLNFLTRAIFLGRTFTHRMYAKFADPLRMQRHKIAVENQAVSDSNAPVKFRKNLKPHHHIQLDSEFKLDCKVWKTFLDMKSASVVN